MKYPQPNDRYDCSVLCSNFMEIEDKFRLQSDEIERVRKSSVANSGAILGEAEGENIHVNDSAEAPPFSLTLYGKAKQNTTQGNNLLKNTDIERITSQGISVKVENSRLRVVGTFIADALMYANGGYDSTEALFTLEAGDYVLQDGLYLTRYDGTKRTNKSKKFTLTEPFNVTAIGIYADASTNNEIFKAGTYYDISIDMMLNSGTELLPFEPYTNGASPNPQYPQPIEVSGESYNLLENTATSQTINGVEFVVNEDGSVTANGTATADMWYHLNNALALESGEYILSGCPSGGDKNSYCMTLFADSNYFDLGSGTLVSIPKSRTVIVDIVIKNGVTINKTFYPMIRKASVKNDRYMPYGKGSVEVKSVGKNLLKNTPITNTVKNVNYIIENNKVLLNGTSSGDSVCDIGTVHLKAGSYIVSGGVSNSIRLRIAYAEEDETKLITHDRGDSPKITLSEDANIVIQARVSSGEVCNNLILYPMVSLEGGEYEPYRESVSVINGEFAGIKVSSNGNYTDQNGQQWICDEIVKYADGSGAYIQRVEKVVFDGSDDEGWTLRGVSNGDVRPSTLFISSLIKRPSANGKVDYGLICNQFIQKSANDTYLANIGISVEATDGCLNIYSDKYNERDLTNWKTHLAENPMVVYYELATPIVTPLTAEEIAAWENLSMFNPVTNITNDAGANMAVEYIADTNIYIDNLKAAHDADIRKLTAAIEALGGTVE